MWMEGLGRVINVVPIAAGRGLRLDVAEAITFVCTGNDTFTVTAAPTFAGSYTAVTPSGTTLAADHGVRCYKSTATNGSAAWVRDDTLVQASPNGHTVVIASGTVAFCIGGDILPDGQRYVKVSVAASGLVTAVFHDLDVQRAPQNLAIVSA